jgi:folylpolyglutamate synthase
MILQVTDLNQLKVIHIAGTKGKGSTSAFCEIMLRSRGLKTGLFTSPHLLEVRERIRINGRPIGKEVFGTSFFECWERLSTHRKERATMPAYFRFLTLMAFHIFIEEKVDVAIIEVGIGGHYDSTNIIPTPYACGISSIGHDHLDILGNTLAQIAWHKAGIFKVTSFKKMLAKRKIKMILFQIHL